ncbi:hypothetical protein AA313_de0202687 [Arthrobotrys entomopaga]|nr:hypothetical protein AA313_de0202687 [Arthrobotrys entomopaga]
MPYFSNKIWSSCKLNRMLAVLDWPYAAKGVYFVNDPSVSKKLFKSSAFPFSDSGTSAPFQFQSLKRMGLALWPKDERLTILVAPLGAFLDAVMILSMMRLVKRKCPM